jgi:hypothetical protein
MHYVVGKKQQSCWWFFWVPKGHKWACWKGRKPIAWHLMPLHKHLGNQSCKCCLRNHKIFNPSKSRSVNTCPSVLFMFNHFQFCIVFCCQFIICYLSLVICHLASCFVFTFVQFCSVIFYSIFCSSYLSVSFDYFLFDNLVLFSVLILEMYSRYFITNNNNPRQVNKHHTTRLRHVLS